MKRDPHFKFSDHLKVYTEYFYLYKNIKIFLRKCQVSFTLQWPQCYIQYFRIYFQSDVEMVPKAPQSRFQNNVAVHQCGKHYSLKAICEPRSLSFSSAGLDVYISQIKKDRQVYSTPLLEISIGNITTSAAFWRTDLKTELFTLSIFEINVSLSGNYIHSNIFTSGNGTLSRCSHEATFSHCKGVWKTSPDSSEEVDEVDKISASFVHCWTSYESWFLWKRKVSGIAVVRRA